MKTITIDLATWNKVTTDRQVLLTALESISANTCCAACQEAKRVATSALRSVKGAS